MSAARNNKMAYWAVIACTLAILAAGIAITTAHLRKVVRNEILQQDGEVLYAASLFSREELRAELAAELGGDQSAMDELSFLLEPEEQLLRILSNPKTKLRGVFAVRLYGPDGRMISSFPPGIVRETQLPKADQERSALGQSQTELLNSSLGSVLMQDLPEQQPVAIIRALVPLQQAEFSGTAEFLLDGKNVAGAFAALHRDTFRYGLLIFLVGGGLLTLILHVAFTRLQRANILLEKRTQSLLRANAELALAARTSAVGAITAHLIHDLKSPVFGLHTLMTSRAGPAEDQDWTLAAEATGRIQKLIADVVNVLREEKTIEKYELSVDELLELIRTRIEPLAQKAGVKFISESTSAASLRNKEANLILLIATNLLQNALQATPSGGTVGVRSVREESAVTLEFFDTGPGLPEQIQDSLFSPARSTKVGGTGLGLAISKQLAIHIGAELALKSTSASGTVFVLRVPESILLSDAELALT